MDRYTLLLVDDEEEVVQVIRKKINWERAWIYRDRLCKQRCESAGNGRGASAGCSDDRY